jgi:3-hydroxyisobutyrate dehydrogenase-like beta-hydroxyacid dehydrogenase
MPERVGFVGVRRMGAPIVRRLLARGYAVLICDLNGDQDLTAIARMYKRWAGVEIRAQGKRR